MALDGMALKTEIINQMKQIKSLSKNADGTDIDLDKAMGDFALALAKAIVKHITKNAVVNTDARTVS